MHDLNHFRHPLIDGSALLVALLAVVFGAIFGVEIIPSLALVSAQKVVVNPGDNIQDIVDRNPEGTTFLVKAGVHRQQSIVPKDRDSFIGEPGAILSGAKPLSSFEREARYWVAAAETDQGYSRGERRQEGYQGRAQQGPWPQGPFQRRRPRGPFQGRGRERPSQGQREQGPFRGRCMPDRPACVFPEDVFIDDAPLQRVTSLDDVTPGKWYADSAASKIYLADDPAGHKVEISQTRNAFSGLARDVTIHGLIVEKYAQPAGEGAITGHQRGSRPFELKGHALNWVVEENEVRLNHAAGIAAASGWRVLKNKAHHNGQTGIGGTGRDLLIEGNEIAYNNYAGYHPGWEAGGSKFAFTQNLVVRDNYVHDNVGPGLWTDLDNEHALYEHNHLVSNTTGIMHEISFDAVIRNNTIEHDGLSPFGEEQAAPLGSARNGAGILIAESSNVEVYGNTVTDCKNGIIGRQLNRAREERGFPGQFANGRPYLIRNLHVHDNVVSQVRGIAAGIFKPGQAISDDIFIRWNNRFENNTFKLRDPNGNYFLWKNAPRTLAEWRELGNR